LCVLFASATTAFLNLDTTAVLLTPVMLATAVVIGAPKLPLAILTVWLANTASLLLPVSNLTNLLAANRVDLSPAAFAARMAVPEVASIAATAACLWLLYWRPGRRGSKRYEVPRPVRPQDPVRFTVAAVACAVFVVLVLVGAPLWVASVVGTGAVVVTFAVRDRPALKRWQLIPFRLLAFVTGLFLVVQAVDRHGLGRVLARLVGTDPGVLGVGRAGVVGAGLSNVLNNLPAYVAGEAAITPVNHDQLLGLLIGTNVGPLITPWASLAIIIWYEGCRRDGVVVRWRSFAATGVVTAVITLAASLSGLVLGPGG
jgi:arsenical pump membrane protein